MLGLEGKRVLVTGASLGIGATTATLFARLGAHVAVAYRSSEAEAMRVVEGARSHGVQAHAFAADLSRWEEGERLVAEVEARLGPIDVAVLNHGIWKGVPVDEMGAGEYDQMLDANLRGYFSVAGAVARRMKPRRSGRIVLVSSTAGQRGEANCSHYAASKGAAISFTKSLASELAPWGILVNCVAPGWVATGMTESTLADPREGPAVIRTIPLGRVARPEEIAWPIAFLASEGATFVTGEIFNVNGGAVLVG